MIEIIPAIDLIDGKCVRLSQGRFDEVTQYYEDPADMARAVEDAGLARLHMVDLDGARAGKVIHTDVLERIATATKLKIDFGGGIRTEEDLKKVLDSGAAQVVVGSLAVRQPETVQDWLARYGPEALILGADIKEDRIAISGWEEQSGLGVWEFLRSWREQGLQYTLSTDISRDGMMSGPAHDLYQEIQKEIPGLQVIASGGVRDMEDVRQLNEAGIYGAVIGKAIYEGAITLKEIADYIC